MAAAREGIRGAEEDGAVLRGEVRGELAGGGGFAGAVDADQHDDLGRDGGVGDGALNFVEYGLQLGLEEGFELLASRECRRPRCLCARRAGGDFQSQWRWLRSLHRRRGGAARGTERVDSSTSRVRAARVPRDSEKDSRCAGNGLPHAIQEAGPPSRLGGRRGGGLFGFLFFEGGRSLRRGLCRLCCVCRRG